MCLWVCNTHGLDSSGKPVKLFKLGDSYSQRALLSVFADKPPFKPLWGSGSSAGFDRYMPPVTLRELRAPQGKGAVTVWLEGGENPTEGFRRGRADEIIHKECNSGVLVPPLFISLSAVHFSSFTC